MPDARAIVRAPCPIRHAIPHGISGRYSGAGSFSACFYGRGKIPLTGVSPGIPAVFFAVFFAVFRPWSAPWFTGVSTGVSTGILTGISAPGGRQNSPGGLSHGLYRSTLLRDFVRDFPGDFWLTFSLTFRPHPAPATWFVTGFFGRFPLIPAEQRPRFSPHFSPLFVPRGNIRHPGAGNSREFPPVRLFCGEFRENARGVLTPRGGALSGVQKSAAIPAAILRRQQGAPGPLEPRQGRVWCLGVSCRSTHAGAAVVAWCADPVASHSRGAVRGSRAGNGHLYG